MKKIEFSAQSGMSLLEMIIVLAVGGILVALAVTRMINAQTNMERQNLAREFKVNLERARFDAVKRRAIEITDLTRITISTATSYKVLIDLNQNGELDEAAEERTVSFGDRSNVQILGENLVFPVTITFDRFGNTKAINGSNEVISPVFTFCEGECTLETATVANSNIISLSATGTVAMMNGGETLPTFDDPTVSDVPTGTAMNEWVVERDDDATLPIPYGTPTPYITPSVSPTPSSSPTPSISPTATPNGSPNATPSGSPTASPTATPTPPPTPTPANTCRSGQKPSQIGCVCVLPMTVRPNGKCQ
jgi:prepilin-type N-terminal cleavage/methylation domain-containing protein